MEDCVLIKENWSEMSSILEQQHCRSHSQATSWRKNLTLLVLQKQNEVLFWSQLILLCVHFCLSDCQSSLRRFQMGALSYGFKYYYRNLRAMSIILKICLFTTFNIAVTMVKCSGNHSNSFYWISSLHFERFQRSPSLQSFV